MTPAMEGSKAVLVIPVNLCLGPISGSDPVQLLEKIVTDQRNLLKDALNTSDVTTIPQVWTMCE